VRECALRGKSCYEGRPVLKEEVLSEEKSHRRQIKGKKDPSKREENLHDSSARREGERDSRKRRLTCKEKGATFKENEQRVFQREEAFRKLQEGSPGNARTLLGEERRRSSLKERFR